MRRSIVSALLCVFAVAWASAQETTLTATGWRLMKAEEPEAAGPITLSAGMYAVFHTTDGDFIARLYSKEAPNTVENFVGLATGRKPWKHPITMAESKQPLYNNTAIYEIVKDIMVRGGDPLDKGTGDPGFQLEVETAPGIGFDTPGVIGMQNSGKKANGSRWFIMLAPIPDWTGRYTAFGKVIGGLDVVRQISRKPTKRPTIPLEPTLVNSIEIIEMPAGNQTTASFSTENGNKVLTIEKNFSKVAVATPAPATVPVVRATTGTATGATTGTKELTSAGSAQTTATK